MTALKGVRFAPMPVTAAAAPSRFEGHGSLTVDIRLFVGNLCSTSSIERPRFNGSKGSLEASSLALLKISECNFFVASGPSSCESGELDFCRLLLIFLWGPSSVVLERFGAPSLNFAAFDFCKLLLLLFVVEARGGEMLPQRR